MTSRRQFLKTTAALAGSAYVWPAYARKKEPLLAFSTLGCPDWSLAQIAEFGHNQGFQGIEVRGILREMDLPTCKEFSAQNIATTQRLMQDKGLKFVNLGSGATLHFAEGSERRKNIDDGKRFIDLANKLSCPYIRVFPNNFQKNQTKAQTMELIVKGLLELGEYSKGSNVSVLLETHGDLLYTDDLAQLMNMAAHKNVGLVWDMTNMWVKTNESPAYAYSRLKQYIHHTHIKNARLEGDKIIYTRLAQGEVPIFEMIDALRDGGYEGFYSFEWEKMWHPELEAPELTIADYAVEMRKYFKR